MDHHALIYGSLDSNLYTTKPSSNRQPSLSSNTIAQAAPVLTHLQQKDEEEKKQTHHPKSH